jgi:cytochrome b subunit of formate dehydrogenase
MSEPDASGARAAGAAADRGGFKQPALLPLDTAQRGQGRFVWRFNRAHRAFHALAILTFYTLVLTGIPLRYANVPFSPTLIRLWGGVESAGLIHRVSAAIMVVYTLIFVAWITGRFLWSPNKKRLLWGADSMVPHPQDVKDFFGMWRYFFTGKDRPRFGRYGYLEKLDFFGEVWGFIIIGGTGVILWFPEFFGAVLPGWWFNVATVFHGYEALIAAGFIFIVHFFNVHLRPDKFPLDAVMFHGRATLEYMEEEHPSMMDQIEARAHEPQSPTPDLDAPAPPPSALGTLVSAVFGMTALGIGILCIGMIAWAALFS